MKPLRLYRRIDAPAKPRVWLLPLPGSGRYLWMDPDFPDTHPVLAAERDRGELVWFGRFGWRYVWPPRPMEKAA